MQIDPLGNYKFCSACIIGFLGIVSQRLFREQWIKRHECFNTLTDMSKSNVVEDKLQKFGDRVEHFRADWLALKQQIKSE